MREFRCKKCKKLLGYFNLKHGEIEIKCKHCKAITRAEAIDINICYQLLAQKYPTTQGSKKDKIIKKKGGEKVWTHKM